MILYSVDVRDTATKKLRVSAYKIICLVAVLFLTINRIVVEYQKNQMLNAEIIVGTAFIIFLVTYGFFMHYRRPLEILRHPESTRLVLNEKNLQIGFFIYYSIKIIRTEPNKFLYIKKDPYTEIRWDQITSWTSFRIGSLITISVNENPLDALNLNEKAKNSTHYINYYKNAISAERINEIAKEKLGDRYQEDTLISHMPITKFIKKLGMLNTNQLK
ncbi:MAG: hypothetical protein SFT92_02365 [Rickettsiales bacterium]|nr:hypothetical protein [Rickettsiales bacterium]